MSKIFIDTNILVYAVDEFDKTKREKCRSLLRSGTTDYQGVISTQVMQEFFVTATKKLGVDPLVAKEILNAFEFFETVTIDPAIVYDAVDCSVINRISFWDSLIVAAAQSARCDKIWTEDLNDGQIIRGVLIENPLD